MSADVIDFYTRQKITVTEPATLEAQANAIFAEAFPGVWPEFSQAQSFHAPDKDSA